MYELNHVELNITQQAKLWPKPTTHNDHIIHNHNTSIVWITTTTSMSHGWLSWTTEFTWKHSKFGTF